MVHILTAGLLLIIGSTLVSFQSASRRLPRFDRPMGAKPIPGIVSLVIYIICFLASVGLLWRSYGWLAGIGTFIVGFWVIPPWFESLWLKRFKRQARAVGYEP